MPGSVAQFGLRVAHIFLFSILVNAPEPDREMSQNYLGCLNKSMAIAPSANNPAAIAASSVPNPCCTRDGAVPAVDTADGVDIVRETACAVGWAVGCGVRDGMLVAVGDNVAEA